MLNRLMMMGPLRDEADPEPGGGGGSGFDPAAFEKRVIETVNKTVNGAIRNLKNELAKSKQEPEPKPSEPEPDAQDGQKPDPRVKALEKRLADMAAKFEAAEKARQETEARARTERMNSMLRTELLKHVPADRIDAAMRIFAPDVKYSEDGSIVGGADELPLSEFIEAAIQKYDYLLPPKNVGGAGATPGNRRNQQTFNLEDIKPGMKPDEIARIREHIARVMAEQSGR